MYFFLTICVHPLLHSSSLLPIPTPMALLHSCCCYSTPPSLPSLLSFRSSKSNHQLFTVFAIRPQSRRFPRTSLSQRLKATITVEPSANSCTERAGESPKLLLEVKELSAVISESKEPILKGVNLTVYEGEVSIPFSYLYSIPTSIGPYKQLLQ